MRRVTACGLMLLLGLSCAAGRAAEPQLETDDQKTLYSLGLALSQRLAPFGLSETDIALVQAGLADGALGREARVDLEAFGPRIDALLRTRLAVAADAEKAAGKEFLEVAANEAGAVRTESGMVYVERVAGSGGTPTPADTVRVNYEGSFRDGKTFDSSADGEPATFPLSGVAPCFAEGLQRMKIGGKSKLVCPSDLAYGDDGFPPVIPPGATLVFEVELVEIVSAEGETPAP